MVLGFWFEGVGDERLVVGFRDCAFVRDVSRTKIWAVGGFWISLVCSCGELAFPFLFYFLLDQIGHFDEGDG